jgi:hypothetical protein
MNTNHICLSCSLRSKPLPIRLTPLPVDERAVFVHSVCASLIDSRFGPGRSTPMVVHLSEWPERGATALYDLTIEGPIPLYSVLSDSEITRRYVAAAIRRELELYELAGVSIRGQSPSTLGRGSPQMSLGRMALSVPPAVAGG